MTDDEIKAIIQQSSTRREILERLEWGRDSKGYKRLYRWCHSRNVPLDHLVRTIPYASQTKRGEYSLDEILVANSTYQNRAHLKRRLIRTKTLQNICSECGSEPLWKGKLLVLQLEHKNGISNDNRLENLSLLCPNCHSQTTTYAGRNVIRKSK